MVMHQSPGGPVVLEGVLVEPQAGGLPRRADPGAAPARRGALRRARRRPVDAPDGRDRSSPPTRPPQRQTRRSTRRPRSGPARARPTRSTHSTFRWTIPPRPGRPARPSTDAAPDEANYRVRRARPRSGRADQRGRPHPAGHRPGPVARLLPRPARLQRGRQGAGNAVLASGDDPARAARGRPAPRPISRRLVHVNLEVDDIEAAYERLRESGVRVHVRAPGGQPGHQAGAVGGGLPRPGRPRHRAHPVARTRRGLTRPDRRTRRPVRRQPRMTRRTCSAYAQTRREDEPERRAATSAAGRRAAAGTWSTVPACQAQRAAHHAGEHDARPPPAPRPRRSPAPLRSPPTTRIGWIASSSTSASRPSVPAPRPRTARSGLRSPERRGLARPRARSSAAPVVPASRSAPVGSRSVGGAWVPLRAGHRFSSRRASATVTTEPVTSTPTPLSSPGDVRPRPAPPPPRSRPASSSADVHPVLAEDLDGQRGQLVGRHRPGRAVAGDHDLRRRPAPAAPAAPSTSLSASTRDHADQPAERELLAAAR